MSSKIVFIWAKIVFIWALTFCLCIIVLKRAHIEFFFYPLATLYVNWIHSRHFTSIHFLSQIYTSEVMSYIE